MLKKRSLITLLGLLLIMAMIFTACGGNNDTPEATPSPSPTVEATPTPETTPAPEEPAPVRVRPETDREGYAISLPDEINTIISIGPSNTEILVALGLSDRIVAADMFSADVPGIPSGISTELSIMGLDAEYVVNLMPDLVFITGMARAGGDDDPLAPVSAAGITVIYMPTSVSIAAIMEDIRFIAAVMEASEAGEGIISAMQAEIDEIAQIAATISETRTVYFEISPAPWMFSFGTETFLNEMIELVGATNIFADQVGWIPVTDEVLLEANPDVILTSTDFLDDPLGEIMERPGFNVITAVQNGDVFQIDANSSNRPSHNIVIALRQIAEAVFPEYFQ